jgi:hypothetical protein
VHDHLVKRLTELDAKEENLLDLVEDGGLSRQKCERIWWLLVRGARPGQGRAGSTGSAAAEGCGPPM